LKKKMTNTIYLKTTAKACVEYEQSQAQLY